MRIEMNTGLIDRSLRLALGAFLLILAITGVIGPWGWIGLIPLLTGLFGWCPLYQLAGIRTSGSSDS